MRLVHAFTRYVLVNFMLDKNVICVHDNNLLRLDSGEFPTENDQLSQVIRNTPDT